MSYCCYLYLTCLDYMSNISDCLTLHDRLCSLPVFAGVCVAHLFSVLCCFNFVCFVCLSYGSCVPNIASVYRLSIFVHF